MNRNIISVEQIGNRKNANQAYFVLCGSCFWCASLLNTRNNRIGVCPSCQSRGVESLPILPDEGYIFGYDIERGVKLDFMLTRKR
jgi:hypothetical protein